MNFKQVDSISYSLYQQKNWKSLAKFEKEAAKSGVDYYYLQMRTGIANFELEKYAFSISRFQKALKFSSYDFTAKSYLYWSYLNMNKPTLASRYSRTFSEKQQKELNIKKNVLNSIDFYGGYMFSNNYAENGKINLLGDGSGFGEQLLMGEFSYFNLGLNFNLSKSLILYASTSFLDIEKQTRFQYFTNQYAVSSTRHFPQGGYENTFSERLIEQEKTFDGFIRQNELYLNAKVQLDEGWAFNVFGNTIFNSLNKIVYSFETITRTDTLSYNAQQNNYTIIPIEEYDFQFDETDTSFVNWVAGFSIQKDINFLKIDLSPSVSHIYDSDQFQLDLSVTYYPLGSLKLYGQTGGIYFTETNKYLSTEERFLFYQVVGCKLSEKVWIETDFYSGNLTNVNLKQAAIVYNLPDKLNYLAGLNLYIFVNQNLSFSLLYDFADKSGFYYNWNETEQILRVFTTNYQTQTLIGSIRWKL